MQRQVSDRFLECLNALKADNKIRSMRQFALTVGIHPQCISDVATGKRDVSNEMIYKATELFELNPSYLFTGKGPLFTADKDVFDISEESEKETPVIAVVTDEIGEERIVHVPIEAQAGYGQQLHDPIYLKELPTFTLPGSQFNRGSYRCFDIAGDSMEPTLFAGDKVVCSFVEPHNITSSIRNNYVYVVITNDGVVIKRLKNTIKQNQSITLISDNSYYSHYDLHVDEVKEVWMVTHKISPFMPNPSNVRNALHAEVDILKDTISDQSKMIRSLNSTVEKLLKMNRSTNIMPL
ncbi:MAG: peptidase S24 [Saprospiraceae bacterium]|nr:peptidase S24 [Saprospiraceae bacterium]